MVALLITAALKETYSNSDICSPQPKLTKTCGVANSHIWRSSKKHIHHKRRFFASRAGLTINVKKAEVLSQRSWGEHSIVSFSVHTVTLEDFASDRNTSWEVFLSDVNILLSDLYQTEELSTWERHHSAAAAVPHSPAGSICCRVCASAFWSSQLPLSSHQNLCLHSVNVESDNHFQKITAKMEHVISICCMRLSILLFFLHEYIILRLLGTTALQWRLVEMIAIKSATN